MSQPQHRFSQEPDLSSGGSRIGLIIVITLLVFGIGVAWSYGILERRQEALAPIGPKELPLEANGVGVGMVIHWMFDAAGAQPPLAVVQEQRLNSFGWTDRAKQRIHIPIDRAIDRVVEHKEGQ